MPKVLFVVPHLSNSTRLLADYLRFLDERFEVTLFAMDNDMRFAAEFPQRAKVIVRKPAGKLLGPLSLFWQIFRASKKQDLLVSWMELTPTYFLGMASFLRRTPMIAWVHANLSRVFGLNMRPAKLHKPMMKLFYPRCHAVVGVSEGVAADLRQHFDLPEAFAIVNGVDLSRCRELAKMPLPEHLKHVFEKPTLVNVAALHPQKNQALLLGAVKKLRDEGLDFNLLFVGSGELKDALTKQAVELGIEKSVHFSGYIDNPYPLVHAATVFALSSNWEGLPLVVVEALGLGATIVSTDCPSGPREILDGGKYGTLVPVNDLDALTDGIRAALRDPAKRAHYRTISDEGAQRFSIVPKTREMEELFWDALGEDAIPARDAPAVA